MTYKLTATDETVTYTIAESGSPPFSFFFSRFVENDRIEDLSNDVVYRGRETSSRGGRWVIFPALDYLVFYGESFRCGGELRDADRRRRRTVDRKKRRC